MKDGADKYDPRVIVRIRAGETITAATYIDLTRGVHRQLRVSGVVGINIASYPLAAAPIV